jgi:hypothetical protein
MKAIAYTYSILRYVHDPAVGEALNIGVVLYAPSVRFLAVRLEYRYQRLSQTFAGFDGDQYRTALRQLESAIEWVKDTWSGRSAQDLPADFQGLIAIHRVGNHAVSTAVEETLFLFSLYRASS